MVNRSEVVGRPLAALLANDGACVYSVDVTGVQQFTRGEGIKERRHKVVDKEGWGLKECVPLSDVVITGVPGNSYNFPTELLREGAVCINFSTEKVSNFQLSRVAWHFPRPVVKGSILSLPTGRLQGIWLKYANADRGLRTEFRSRGQGESFDIRACHWKGDNRYAITEPGGQYWQLIPQALQADHSF